jgi:hypothetical protein
MARGLRSSNNKNNNTKLRAKVFGPVEDARTARLSAKLMELASQSLPIKPQTEGETAGKEQRHVQFTYKINYLVEQKEEAQTKETKHHEGEF